MLSRQALLATFDKHYDRLIMGRTDKPDYHDRYYTHSRDRYRYVLGLMPDDFPSLRILEVGTAEFPFFLRSLYPDLDLTVFDVDDWALERFRQSRIPFFLHDLEREGELPEASFDLILFGEVLEHLKAIPQKVFQRLRKALKPGGRILLTTPNLLALGSRLKFACGINPLELVEMVRPGHFREWDLAELKLYLAEAGLEVELAEFPEYWNNPWTDVKLYRFAGVPWWKILLFKAPYILLKKVLTHRFPTLRASIAIVARRPASE